MGNKPDVVVCVYNPGIWEMEAGGSGVQGHPLQQSTSNVSLDYVRPCLKETKAN